MARPTTKTELLDVARTRHERLWALVDSMSPEEQEATFAFEPKASRTQAHWTRDTNLRDVLVHVHEWHRLLLDWVAANTTGDGAPFLPPPYTWKTYGDMNVEIWRRHQGTSLEEAKRLLRSSHPAVIALIETFDDEELFTRGRLPWTGGSTLGSYCVSVTSSHDDWAVTKLRAHLASRRGR